MMGLLFLIPWTVIMVFLYVRIEIDGFKKDRSTHARAIFMLIFWVLVSTVIIVLSIHEATWIVLNE